MNLLNEKVTHNVFGNGKIVSQDETVITIDFNEDVKRFVYPDIFETFVSLKDQDIAASLKQVISNRKKEEEALKKQLEEQREQEALEQERLQLLEDRKIHESSQIVFWLDEEEEKNVFTDWEVFTGEVQSGKSKGQPNRAVRLGPNSASLLTVRDSNQPETERRILGIYMVGEAFSGNMSEDGIVPAHTEFKIELTEEEADKMLFWNYYINHNYPERTAWNSGKYRYFDNAWTAQILKDIIALRTDEEEIKHAQSFLEYFCQMNVFDIDDIPEASGALKQS